MLRGQMTSILSFTRSQNIKLARSFFEIRTNGDRHFAEVAEFRAAVAHAQELGVPVVVGSLLQLLSATSPDKILEALSEALGHDVVILDATLGRPLLAGDATRIAKEAIEISRNRRRPIVAGLKSSKTVRQPDLANQAKAARGAALAADARARRLKPVVDAIIAEKPSRSIGPTSLAKELNARGVLTARGKPWSPTTARDLLNRLNRAARPDQGHGAQP